MWFKKKKKNAVILKRALQASRIQVIWKVERNQLPQVKEVTERKDVEVKAAGKNKVGEIRQ